MDVYAFLVLFFALAAVTVVSGIPVIAEEGVDGKCHCNTELTLNIPPCSCPGMVDVVKENYLLKEELRELKDNCTVTVGLTVPCE